MIRQSQLRFLADEDFDNDILRGLLRRMPDLDITRVQDAGLGGAKDPVILEWAAQEGRVLLTHDVSTISTYALARINDGLPMPGVFAVSQSISTSQIIEDIMLLAECSVEGEWEDQIYYLPL
jgi:hypothetical protein